MLDYQYLNVIWVDHSSSEIKLSAFAFYNSDILLILFSSMIFHLLSTQFLVTVLRFVLFHNGILWWWITSNFDSGWSLATTIGCLFLKGKWLFAILPPTLISPSEMKGLNDNNGLVFLTSWLFISWRYSVGNYSSCECF